MTGNDTELPVKQAEMQKLVSESEAVAQGPWPMATLRPLRPAGF